MRQRVTLSSVPQDLRELLEGYAAVVLTLCALAAIFLGQWRLGCTMLVFTIPVYLGLWAARTQPQPASWGTLVPTAVHPTYIWVLYEAEGELVAAYTDPLVLFAYMRTRKASGFVLVQTFQNGVHGAVALQRWDEFKQDLAWMEEPL
jgi:hypothetical protein